jgi:peptidoglycan/xylan/chitin deacetylase (PgdA/CDA1 family)
VDDEVNTVLDFLDELNVVATCFIVGRLAKERPHVAKSIADRGHEVASHSFEHVRMSRHDPKSFAEDLRASITVLEDVTGIRVKGFRAPAFSLGSEQVWAFQVMADNGIEYDSSVRLVWPFGSRAARALIAAATACGIEEHPGLALGCGALRVPLAGGGGLRLVPEWMNRLGMDWARKAGYAIPVYVHPYDLTSRSPAEWPSARWNRRARLEWLNWMQHRGRLNVRSRVRRAAEHAAAEEYILTR